MNAIDNFYRYKLSMYWGSKWRTYFALYYAFTFAEAYEARLQYNFPLKKNRGWAIENLETREVENNRDYDEYTP